MKFEKKIMILSALLILISVSLSSIESVLAQSGKSLAQDGDDNEASQSKLSSQETNQNSMCVSGESTSLSCNNLSDQSIGSGQQGEEGPVGPEGPVGKDGATGERGPSGPQGVKGDTGAVGPAGPQSIDSKAYKVTGQAAGDGETSTADCKEGDTVMSGGFELFTDSSSFELRLKSVPTSELDGWEASASGSDKLSVTPVAVCFDNP